MTTVSGFCGASNPLDSHQRCTKDGCPCVHHVMEAAPVPEPANVVDPVTGLADAVEALAKAMPALVAAADDPQALGLARLLLDVREARTSLYQLELDLEGITAKALMDDQVDGEGVRVERHRSRDRKEWDHAAWLRDVRAKVLRKHGALKGAQLLSADGELLEVNLYDVLADVQAVHGAGQPKVTALRQLGLDAADYCATTPGTAHVRVLRMVDETETTEVTGG